MHTKKIPALLAALALASTLAACSGGGDGATAGGTGSNPALSDAFDWSRESHGPAKEIAFAFPDALVEIAPELEDIAAAPISAKARELDSAKHCAVDVEYQYPQGVKELTGGTRSEDEVRFHVALGYWSGNYSMPDDATTYQELRSAAEAALKAEQRAFGSEEETVAAYAADTLAADEEFIEQRVRDARAAQVEWNSLTEGQRLHGADALPVSELDGAEDGVFYSEDLSTITYVMECASDASDPEGGDQLRVRLSGGGLQYGDSGTARMDSPIFADAWIVAMKNGDVLLYDAEVRGYETDSNGDWIAD